ncbi:MAG: PIN domain-containing protein [Halobacteria archaeon]
MTSDRTLVFDANGLMIPGKFGVHIFHESEGLVGGFEAVVPSVVVDELEKLSTGDEVSGEGKKAAELALDLVEDRCRVVETKGYADDVIVEYSVENDVAGVVTNDTRLKERLYKNNIPVLYLRQQNHLELGYP